MGEIQVRDDGDQGATSIATLTEGLTVGPQVGVKHFPNWFEITGRANFDQLLPRDPDRPMAALQIGSFTGDASAWLLENVLTHPDSTLTDVDTWAGSDEEVHQEFDWRDVEGAYDRKVAAHVAKVRKCKMTSDEFFVMPSTDLFDFAYVDGDHTARQTMIDGINAFDRVVVGGIIAFDDYTWQSGKGVYYDPGMGINAFLAIHQPYLDVIAVNAQLWVRKVGHPA